MSIFSTQTISLLETVSKLKQCIAAVRSARPYDRFFYVFWLMGPFIMLIERSPADVWITLIAIAFILKQIVKFNVGMFKIRWVLAFALFFLICVFSSILSDLPFYSLGETIAWSRFPIFAMAVYFWIGRDEKLLTLMLISICMGVLSMVLILFSEYLLVGQVDGRLSWPYGDLVPGNYLTKVGLPGFLVVLSFVKIPTNCKQLIPLIFVCLALVASFLTGERINFLILLLSAFLVLSLKDVRYGVLICGIFFVVILTLSWVFPTLIERHLFSFIEQLPVHQDSLYFRAFLPGVLAFIQEPFLGVGPGNLRYLCGAISEGQPMADCHPHPHNFYLQIIGEVGIVGLCAGIYLIAALIAEGRKGLLTSGTVFTRKVLFIVPLAFFWPIVSTPDFFGQWNNCFMWSSIAFYLAACRQMDFLNKRA